MSKKKYFICSDIHSFYTPFRKALKEAGFNPKTKSHILVILGDLFDRGEEAVPLYNFITSLPKERRILVRGNHEYLLRELYTRGFAHKYDISNGTLGTLYQFIGLPSNYPAICRENFFREMARSNLNFGDAKFQEARKQYFDQLDELEYKLYHNMFAQSILDWIFSDEWINIFETKHYLFVHSFIPLNKKEIELDGIHMDVEYSYKDNWRLESTEEEWEDATWGCPWSLYQQGLLDKEGKTLVCGHWHTSDFWNKLSPKTYGKLDVRKDNPLFRVDGIKLIGLDACTAATGKVNVLVLKEDEL